MSRFVPAVPDAQGQEHEGCECGKTVRSTEAERVLGVEGARQESKQGNVQKVKEHWCLTEHDERVVAGRCGIVCGAGKLGE